MDLKKEMGMFGVFCLSSGAMISSGLFVLPGIAHAAAGPAVILSYILAALLALCGVLSIAELATAMPKAGGDYFYIVRSMGPAIGTVAGLLSWFSISMKSAFALIGMAAFTGYLVQVNIHLVAAGLCLLFLLINLFGVRYANQLQIFLVIGLLGLLLGFLGGGLPAVEFANLKPFFSKGYLPVFSTAGMVFISFGGILKIASVSEEVEQPARNIPGGMLLSMVIISLLYVLTVFVASGVLPGQQLDASLTPITDAAQVFLGRPGQIALSIGAILAFISTANAGIMAASRYPLALSRDKLLPEFLGKVNERFNTPHFSILITGIFMIMMLFLQLKILVKAASTVLIFTYILSCLSVLILRESKIRGYRPTFQTPFYPYLQIGGVIGYTVLIFEMGNPALFTVIFLILSGFLIYWFYGRQRVQKEYALIHLLDRVLKTEYDDHSLEVELREIIYERDSREKNQIHALIEDCDIIDIRENISYKRLFDRVTQQLAKSHEMEAEEMFDAFVEREEDVSTILEDFAAIPHIVVPGEEKFSMTITRCREGITFPGGEEVELAFILTGSEDQREFHLNVMAFLADVLDSEDFYERIIEARDKETIRNLLLFFEQEKCEIDESGRAPTWCEI